MVPSLFSIVWHERNTQLIVIGVEDCLQPFNDIPRIYGVRGLTIEKRRLLPSFTKYITPEE